MGWGGGGGGVDIRLQCLYCVSDITGNNYDHMKRCYLFSKD